MLFFLHLKMVLLGVSEDSFIETVGKFITVSFQCFNEVQMGISDSWLHGLQ